MVVESGECKTCSELFVGCGKCSSDECTGCSEEGWTVTANGCYKVEDPSDSSHAEHLSSSSKKPNNIGMIVGICVGALVAVAIIIIIVYFAVKARPKRDKTDPVIADDDDISISMSVI